MGSGGGGDSTTYSDVKTTTSNLPEYAEPYYRDLLARTGFETAQGYEQYGAQRQADFSPMEQEAMARYGELGMSGTPEELNEAGRIASAIGQGDPNITTRAQNTYQAGDMGDAGNYAADSRSNSYRANQLGDSGFYGASGRDMGFQAGTLNDPNMLQSYMNPYQQNVVDIQKREAMRDADIRHQQTGLDAAGMGSLGGYREGVMRAETERNLGRNMMDIQQTGQQAAYADAKASYEADRAARAQEETFGQSQFGMNEQLKTREAELVQQGFSLDEASRQAQEELSQGQFGLNSQNQQFAAQISLEKYNAGEAAKQKAAELGLSEAEINQAGEVAAANVMLGYDQNRLAAAGLLGDFAGQRQSMEMDRLQSMQQAGQQQRGLQQSGLDIGYQDFLRQQGWGKEQLAFYSNMLQGASIKPGETTASYGDKPSTGQELLGGGIGALGLYNAMNGGG
jgi:hypothetical protein